ncbi:hypothetical protein niasHT_016042 [Heterodera trifolii]|uniref:MADF domain-containing protein n=1 Tax=Heterodera trifolii TaxID=157864 RepID=A0ABD2LEU9_9BILA
MNSATQNEHVHHQQQQFQPAATFNELLINEVRSHPQLYDQQHRVCTDNGERNAIWEVIASRIDDSVNGEFAKKRWLQMRDRYRKELKMALRTSIQPKWPYFTKLAWLDPYLKDAKNIKSVSAGASHQQQNALADFSANANHQIGIFRGDFAEQLRLSQLGNTVSFLESLMAASSALLQQQQHKTDTNGDFSTDSAEASTSEGDGGAAEPQHSQSLHNELLIRASSSILMGGVGTEQPNTTGEQRCSQSASPKDDGMEQEEEETEEGPVDSKDDDEEGTERGHSADPSAKCHTDFAAELSLLRRSASASSPLGPASAEPSTEFVLNALFARSSPFRLLGSTLLNSTAPTTSSIDNDHSDQRRALSAFAPASKSPVTYPTRHHRFVSTPNGNGTSLRNNSGGNGQPPYLIRRGFGVSKSRGRLASGTLPPSDSANSVRKFDIVSMCSSPTEICGDGDTKIEEEANSGKANNGTNCWTDAMEWADGRGNGTANANGTANNEDEDALFARLVVARLKKFGTKERRAVRSRIFNWLDQKEEEMETATAEDSQ